MNDILQELLARRAGENSNSSNSNKSNDCRKSIESKAVVAQEAKMALSEVATLPVGGDQEGQLGQEEDVGNGPGSLKVERARLVEAGRWLGQRDIAYANVNIWPTLDRQQTRYASYRVQYTLKVGTDTALKKYKSTLTYRAKDYISYPRQLWTDADDWHYPVIAQSMNQINRWPDGPWAFAGRCSENIGHRTTKFRMPTLPYTTILLHRDPEADRLEDDWQLNIWHHAVKLEFSFPKEEWDERLDQWLRKYAVSNEKRQKTPPFIKADYWSPL